jgi:ATPase subunit of ABC transporter with duplicated ATPase domains
MHNPIPLNNISLSFKEKNCFENFTTTIYPGNRIGIIGRNGTGKSSLLKILAKKLQPTMGNISLSNEITIGFVEQTISDYQDLSGGQRFNKKLSETLGLSPDILLLDEPTNHLDLANRKSLIGMLRRYQGTLIIVTHDTEVLEKCIDTLWHIQDQKITTFNGSYQNYKTQIQQIHHKITKELSSLKKEQKNTHAQLMLEQQRFSKSKAQGKQKVKNKQLTKMAGDLKAAKAEKSHGKKIKNVEHKKDKLMQELSDLHIAEVILPKFSLTAENVSHATIVSIRDASLGYKDKTVLTTINLNILGTDRIALCGKNGSGKSTLLKALVDKNTIIKTGQWHLPHPDQVGYLDQHYSNLDAELSVFEHIKKMCPEWQEQEIRRHLNDFLFRKNEEVNQLAKNLSGGEKARLSLSLIAAKTPKLLLLDEITNNLDLETKEHIIQVLQQYPGALLVVSHEDSFLGTINITQKYEVENGAISLPTNI